jgi:hypothetical protein
MKRGKKKRGKGRKGEGRGGSKGREVEGVTLFLFNKY